jgi:murein DD-endopeptidase MepM/ murein hydrolase activator NlpD/transglutaminase-like putative cysteine protease
MRTFSRALRICSAVVLFFFSWTYLPIFQIAAYAAETKQRAEGKGQSATQVRNEGQKPEERFEKALEEIREKVGQVEVKAERDENTSKEIESIKAKRAEIESLDADFKKEFVATEKKLKAAKLPKDLLDRHYKFVKHYEDNLKELKTNLDAIEKHPAKSHEQRAALSRAKEHLEKIKPPKKHVPLDPNKLPNRMVKAKERAPRLKKEEFEKDFPPQKSQRSPRTASNPQDFKSADSRRWTQISGAIGSQSTITNPKSEIHRKPLLLAFNGPASDMPLSLGVQPLKPKFEIYNPHFVLNLESDMLNLAQAAAVDAPTADDLAETAEITFSPELRQIATLLENNPVQLYEFVRNNFTYDTYYGSVKGSQGTLLLQNGNDFDQASVLIALFRVSGIPARYAYGTVEIPIEKVMKWLGGITDPRTAGMVLATNGIPAKLIISGGAIKSVQLEHTWIEVYIPYANYRGLINDPAASKTWIPLDPSFKLTEPNQNAVDLADSQQFDIDNYFASYLQTVKPTTPAKDYLSTTINYVTNNLPGQRFSDLLASGPIIDKVLGLLPDTLSYPVKTTGAKFSTIPDSYRQKITFEFSDPGTNETVLSYTASWATLLHNRFTISYTPAMTTDEQIIANYGDIYSTPSYLINVKPVLKVEGTTVAEGSAIGMGGDLTFKMSFIGPQGVIDNVITNNLTVGATHAIGLGSGYTTGRIITYRTAKLGAAATAGESGDSILGEYLNLLAMNYLQELDSSRKLISKSMKILDTYRTAELMVGVDLGVSRIFGIPRSVNINGLLIDVDYNTATPVDMDGNQSKVRRFQILTGMTSSALEHTMFESIIGVEAVSTIKALEIANVQGIPVHQIDANNIAAKLPLLQLSSEVKADIQNAINAGKVVTVPERNIQLNSWNGVGYIVMEPTTGTGAYLISGGMSGGSLTYNIISLKDQIAKSQITVDDAKRYIRAHEESIWFREPVIGTFIVSRFRTPTRPNHNGVDFQADIGSPVHVVADGTVTRAEYSSPGDITRSYGFVVYVDHGLGLETRYAHNSTLKVEVGKKVSAGEIIAESGNTGHVDPMPTMEDPENGQHVHFEIRLDGNPVNPELFKIEPRGW